MAIDIRLARGSDADDIARIYRPFVESTIISFETAPPERADGRSHHRDDVSPSRLFRMDDALLGTCTRHATAPEVPVVGRYLCLRDPLPATRRGSGLLPGSILSAQAS